MTAVVLALAAGAVVGLALGGLGGGGSMLAVPALIYLIGLTPGTATTASLLIVAATSATGLVAHARAGRVRWRSGLLFATAGLPTAALGGALSSHLPGPALTTAFAALAALAAWRMLTTAAPRPATDDTSVPQTADGTSTRHAANAFPPLAQADGCPATLVAAAPHAPGPAAESASPPQATDGASTRRTANAFRSASPAGGRPATLLAAVPAPRAASARRSAAAGAGLGAATGLLGVGGGFLAVPALVSVLAFPMAEAVGTSLLVITLNSLAALLPRLGGAAEIPWAVVGPFAAAAILGAWDGKRLAAKLSGRTLQRLFAGALLTVAALMLLDAAL
ncbi:sulfite exporter TauE/SafE family protein [Kitasatospora sp. NPDC049285]|uniref:sulfite exporter TauE/SafE family protein n=1 Tax=Kitasatospora sp. NPDC049285 TaxID=3157096 RepID=UPI0034321866